MMKEDVEDKMEDGYSEGLMDIRVFDLPVDIPEEAKTVIALKCCGLSNAAIGRRLGVVEATVRYHLKKYDVDRISERGSEIRRLLLASMFETAALQALSQIKNEDIRKMSGTQKVQFATTCIRAIRDLNPKPYEKMQKTEQEMIDELSKPTAVCESGDVKKLTGVDSGDKAEDKDHEPGEAEEVQGEANG